MAIDNKSNNAKRKTLKLTGKLIASVPLISLVALKKTSAHTSFTKVSEDSPVAKAINYVHDASKVDKNQFPNFKANQICANCHFYTAIEDCQVGGCSIVGKLVDLNGWCRAWYAKS